LGDGGGTVSKIKVIFVYDVIYPYVKGGGERRYYEFGTRLSKMGYDVHWYGMKYWEGSSTKKLDGITLHGLCKARPIYTKSGRRSISQALIFGLSCFKLLFVNFDVIDCCGFPYFSMLPAKLAAIRRHRPLIATWHEVWGKDYWREYLGILGIIGYWIEKIAAKLPNHIIASSSHTANLIKENFGAKNVDVLASGVDINYIAKSKPADTSFDIIYAGRLMDFKNVNLIIQSLAELKNNGKVLTGIIIGDGPEKVKLQHLAKKLGVYDQIIWHGFLENAEDVYAYMKTSKVFILPSKREGFGTVAIESNACGTPVLAADFVNNASKDLIKDGVNGYIFKPTIEGLTASLEKGLKELKNLKPSTLNLVKAYDWDNLSHELVGVYAL